MNTFNAAIRVVLRHPIYILVYIVWLGFLGVFIVQGVVSSSETGEVDSSYASSVAVVDRDGSVLSRALSEHLGRSFAMVEVADEKLAMQDALATGYVDCLLVVPAGFGDAYVEAAREGGELPRVEAAYGYASASGTLASAESQRYLELVAASAALDPDADVSAYVGRAEDASREKAEYEVFEVGGVASSEAYFKLYLMWNTYTMTAGVTVCVGILTKTFNRVEIRRRQVVSSRSSLARGVQLALGSALIALFGWAFTTGLGFAVFGWAVEGMSLTGVGLVVLAALAFSLVPTAFGFLLGQMGAPEEILNAAGNIGAVIVSFLGGAWVSLDMLSPGIRFAAQFSPTKWYGDALDGALALGAPASGAVLPVLADIGVVALFALALFSVALAVGRIRQSNAEAGGNAGALADAR